MRSSAGDNDECSPFGSGSLPIADVGAGRNGVNRQDRSRRAERTPITEPKASARAKTDHRILHAGANHRELGVVEMGHPDRVDRSVVSLPHFGFGLPKARPSHNLTGLGTALAHNTRRCSVRRLIDRHVHGQSFDQNASTLHGFPNVPVSQCREQFGFAKSETVHGCVRFEDDADRARVLGEQPERVEGGDRSNDTTRV